jgi:hypothetical protein
MRRQSRSGGADEFRNLLLCETLIHAKQRSLLYASKLGSRKLEPSFSVDDLDTLPLTRKSEISAFEKDWASCEKISCVQNTSGSTGLPLFVYRNDEECNFIWEFFSGLNTEMETLPRIGLHLAIHQHGTSLPIPGRDLTLTSSVHNDKMLRYTVSLLEKSFTLPAFRDRISVLSGDHEGILLLTNYVKEVEVEHQVDVVITTGRQLTARWRREIERTWSCDVVDRYSLSEIFGGATYCLRCKGFHFDTHVIPEVVSDPINGKAIDHGVGYLVLTTLFPFVQNQPFIRYLTGDLFELEAAGCMEKTYRYLGRASSSLFKKPVSEAEAPELLLPSGPLIDALDSIPGIARPKRFADVVDSVKKDDIGLPIARGLITAGSHSQTAVLAISVTPGFGFSEICDQITSNPTLLPWLEKMERYSVKLKIVNSARSDDLFEKNTEWWIKDHQK